MKGSDWFYSLNSSFIIADWLSGLWGKVWLVSHELTLWCHHYLPCFYHIILISTIMYWECLMLFLGKKERMEELKFLQVLIQIVSPLHALDWSNHVYKHLKMDDPECNGPCIHKIQRFTQISPEQVHAVLNLSRTCAGHFTPKSKEWKWHVTKMVENYDFFLQIFFFCIVI